MAEISDIPDVDAVIEQLAEFFGFEAHCKFTVKGEPYCITYRQFLPADVQRKLREIEKSIEDCDKLEVEMPNGKKIKGSALAIPLRRNGELLPDDRDVLFLKAIWGEDKYRKYDAAGKPPNLLSIVWAKQDAEYDAWRRSKSASGS